MLHGEIGEQLCLQCLQCALILNSHYKNTVVPRCKQGVYVSFAPENWLIWCWKCGMIGKRSPKKASHAGSRMRTSLLLRDHPFHSFCQKISRHAASLVPASAQALSGLPDAGATMSLCQGQDLPRCVWCAPSFCWGIIKRGNGVGRTEWKSRRRRLGLSKCMQLSIMLSCWYAVCFSPCLRFCVVFPIRI